MANSPRKVRHEVHKSLLESFRLVAMPAELSYRHYCPHKQHQVEQDRQDKNTKIEAGGFCPKLEHKRPRTPHDQQLSEYSEGSDIRPESHPARPSGSCRTGGPVESLSLLVSTQILLLIAAFQRYDSLILIAFAPRWT